MILKDITIERNLLDQDTSVVDPKLFFSDLDPDPIFVRVLDPDPDSNLDPF
jgi:hypothetical protein